MSKEPGCYGSALTFKVESMECKGCMFAADCEPLSLASLENIRSKLGIKIPLRRRAAEVIIPKLNETAFEDFLPKKVKAIIEQATKAGIAIQDELMAGNNPAALPQWLRIVVHVLLRSPTGVEKGQLSLALTKTLKWSTDLANAHVTQARCVLLAVGAIKDVDGRLFLRKS